MSPVYTLSNVIEIHDRSDSLAYAQQLAHYVGDGYAVVVLSDTKVATVRALLRGDEA